MSTFTGAGFTLESVVQRSSALVRLTYTQVPRALNPVVSTDALNPSNYTLTGPKTNYVSSATVVPDDLLSIDLWLAAPLAVGEWTLSVQNVQEDNGHALVPPTSMSFPVVRGFTREPVAGGAINSDPAHILRRHLVSSLSGPGWDAIIAAIAAGDKINWENARLAFNQLFLASASGKYLTQRASEDGTQSPPSVAMPDDLFRQLAISLRTDKLTADAILRILEVFYGQSAVRASSTASNFQPYALADGDDLQLLVDGQPLSVIFSRRDFEQIGQATALEVAAAITRTLKSGGSTATCGRASKHLQIAPYVGTVAIRDPVTGQTTVRVFSGSRGVGSSVTVTGGRAQVVLGFDTGLFSTSGGSPFANWDITLSPTSAGSVRFTMNSGIYDLDLVRAGDVVCVFGPEFAASNNQGTFSVTAVDVRYAGPTLVQWFEVANPFASPVAGVSQTQFSDLVFFRPTKKTVYDQPRHVVVALGQEVEIIMPATTQVVGRKPGDAAYMQPPTQLTASLERVGDTVTATTSSPHNLLAGDQVLVDGALPQGAAPAVTAGTPSGDFVADVAAGTADASIKTTVSVCGTYSGTSHRALTLPEGMAMVLGGHTTGNVAIHPAIWKVTGTSTLGDGSVRVNYQWRLLSALSLTAGISSSAASLLQDGRVLITGGYNGAANPINNWDLVTYVEFTSDESIVSGVMPVAVAKHAQVTLADGRVMVCGGITAGPTTTAAAYVMNPQTSVWSAVASMAIPRYGHEAVALRNGKILVVGGHGVAQCELYDPDAGTWSATGAMTYTREDFAVASLPDGRVAVFGGFGMDRTQQTSSGNLATCEVYDPSTGLWSPLPAMSLSRRTPALLMAPSGDRIYVSGGGHNTIEELSTDSLKWRKCPSGLTASLDGARFVLANGVGLLCGGDSAGTTAKTNHVVVFGDEGVWQGGINGSFEVDAVVSASKFTYKTPSKTGFSTVATATIVREEAQVSLSGMPGPYTLESVVDQLPVGAGTFYAAGSAAGRVAAQTNIEKILPAGIDARITVLYPGDRGLGAEGFPADDSRKQSDSVKVWSNDG